MKYFVTLISLIMMKTSLAQNWIDTVIYPFENHYISLPAGKMHYIDEGEGEVILFVHGTPTWSFLYRKFVRSLSPDYRCIAIDHIGFGLSAKPADFAGTPQQHSEMLTAFITRMDLKNVTLVVHDFGGPIGLSSAIQNHERIKQVVLFNSWLWETKSNPDAQRIDRLINSRLGKMLYLRMNVSPKSLLKRGFYDKNKLTRHLHKHYIRPFPTKQSRLGLLNMAKALVGASDWYQTQWKSLAVLEDKPWLIIWGNRDQFIKMEWLKKWQKRLPNARTHELDCGHFVQEEKSDTAIALIRNFMEKQ